MRYLLLLAAMIACLNASPAHKPAGWGPVEYLVGDWTGEGGGGPGQGGGSFSFRPDLQGKILVRHTIRYEMPSPPEAGARRAAK